MKKRLFPIKWKVFTYLIGFCVLLIGVLWMFQTVFLDDFYKRVKQGQVQRDAATISDYILGGDWETLSQLIRSRDELYVEVWTQQGGTILMTTGAFPDAIQSRLTSWSKMLLFQQIRRSGAVVERFSYEETDYTLKKKYIESILYADILETPDGGQHLLMVSANLSPVSATVDTLRLQIYIISGVMLVLSVLLALLISYRVSRPIEKLNKAAESLGKGDYQVRFDAGGYREIAGLAGTLTHAAEELGKTEQLRQELIANVSHDLRTPLTLITGYAEMMRDLPGENTPENMQVIADESKRLTTLVTDLLDLSRLQSGTIAMKTEEFSLTACVSAIIERLAQFYEKDGCEIAFEYSGNAVVVGDSQRISQVIYNLISNALTYTGDDKRVNVRQTVAEGRVAIEVADTGDGIPEEELDHIWERYYRSKGAHKRVAGGAGLGLSIVRSVLEAHPDVKYGVSSRLGEGSIFWFSLPVVSQR